MNASSLSTSDAVSLSLKDEAGRYVASGEGHGGVLSVAWHVVIGFACPLLFIFGKLLVRVLVPDNVVGEANDGVTGALGHLGEAFRLSLVLKGVGREVDARSVDIGLDYDADTANAIKLELFVLVLVAVAH